MSWNFYPPVEPHFGGVWERLVQVFKLSVYKVIGSRTQTDDTLTTLTSEIEANMRWRPIANIPSDIIDPLPLTPIHFLPGRPSINIPPSIFTPTHITISKSWKTTQQLTTEFWNRILKE